MCNCRPHPFDDTIFFLSNIFFYPKKWNTNEQRFLTNSLLNNEHLVINFRYITYNNIQSIAVRFSNQFRWLNNTQCTVTLEFYSIDCDVYVSNKQTIQDAAERDLFLILIFIEFDDLKLRFSANQNLGHLLTSFRIWQQYI